ncbi:hypothetical protein C8A05DRAFT_39600 [Staphylotrichum tortipilum]|uniref:Uncharacterized protein n=1 Tax=Staphylotrichum tortipilum TaxID=2831512 RepID=A0AAN6M9D7_9PEZI|nr:hypothetical protein C8A05DRAFT_39600 [Staphylotrichum longicolle]
MAAMEAANAHYQNGPHSHHHHHHNPHHQQHHQHHQQPGPPLPASPTLTNPDMILPDYPDYNDIPEAALDRADHSLMMWNNSHPSTSASDMHHMFVATGLAGPRPYGPAGPVTPTTPIIYGNGTMLSDIGEVTEVESTVGKPSPVRTKAARRAASPKRGSGSDGALRSSPTVGTAAAAAGMAPKKSKQSLSAKRERRASMESNSTITTEDHAAAAFADFDDSVSVDDSVFQGDDEESMASSYVEGTAAIEPVRLAVAKVENIDRLSTYSTTSLSRRAEEILANAKKRLTTMEGNLTRARSSLHYTSPYDESDGSTPSPPLQRAATAMYLEDHGDDRGGSPHGHTLGHTRMSSDVAMRNGLPYRVSIPRAQSALGAAGGYRQPPLTASKSADHIRSDLEEEAQRSMNRASSVREGGLKPLTVDEVARLGETDSASQNARMEAFLSPTFGSFHSDSGMRNPQRSSSAAQMRDIKDQMRDLKGKISSLREQARVDNLKRRSLQSLRTPSPFTHSQIDTWYEPASNRTSEIITSEMLDGHPWNSEEMSVDGEVREHELPHGDGMHPEEDESDYADAETGIPPEPMGRFSDPEPISPTTPAPEANGEAYDSAYLHSEGGVTDEDQDFHEADDADYMSESGESLYHDTVQHQISHEDREDAFDYEHFFLHSAMGTMSLTRRASTETFTSEGSVETTRGPVADTAGGDAYGAGARVIGRRNSSNSISTIDTFATAQEGRSLKSPVLPDEEGSFRATSAQSHRFRSGSSATSKRLSLNPRPATATRDNSDGDGSISPIAEETSTSASASPAPATQQQHHPRRASVIHRPMSMSLSMSSPTSLNHRPSVSSFESVGTNRSFPLVPASFHASARKANSTGVLTPRPRDSPEFADPDHNHGLNTIASRLMSDMQQQQQTSEGDPLGGAHPLEGLLREDRYLVERLVASLGRCVLGLTENGRASAESRMFRRRIDAARRALEGGEGE